MNNYLNVPPNNRQAELSVIGGCLLSVSARDDVIQILRPEHFYGDDTRAIYAGICEMHDVGKTAIDALTLAEWLESKKRLEIAGGPALIMECMESVPHAAHSAYYAKSILTASQCRAGMQIGQELIRDARDTPENPLEILAKAETAIHAAMETGIQDEPTKLADVLVEALAELNNPTPKPKYIGTEWEHVEEFSSGITLGGVVCLAARPGEGKTALALSLAMRVAESGVGVLFCGYEMQKQSLTARSLSIVSGIEFYKLEKNKISHDERHLIVETSSMMGKWPVYFDDSCRPQSGLLTLIRRMVRRYKVKVVIVDYLQLIEPDDHRANREQQVAGITRALKTLAMKLNIGILLLSQLNREIERRLNREPQLSDLRESGAIEQDSDQVWFVWRPTESKEGAVINNVGKLKVAKNRNGKTGIAEITWQPDTMKFSDSTYDPFRNRL